MCGIAGIYRRTDQPVDRAGRLADELLLAIENRGPHSTGWLAMLDTGKVQMERSLDRASVYVYGRQRFDKTFRTLLLHTRYATIGKRSIENAHPVVNGKCAAVHNGTIYNHGDVFRQLALKRNASVDSEVIPAIVTWGGWDHAAEALSLLDGGMATALVTNERPDELVLARLHGYPLHYVVNDDLIVWASTERAIRTAWARTYGGTPAGRFIEVPPFRAHRITPTTIVRSDIEDRYEVSRWDREVISWQRQQKLDKAKRTKSKGKRSTKSLPESKPTGGRKNGRIAEGAAVLTGTTAKRRRKRSAARSRSASTGAVGATRPEGFGQPWQHSRTLPDDVYEDAIRDTMRWTGMSRIEAEDELLGYSPTRANEQAAEDHLSWLLRDDDDIEWGL